MIFKFLIDFFSQSSYRNYIECCVFIFGLCIGSFLNCVIYRTELQENMPKGSPRRKAVSFLRGKSFCPHCKHTLSWQDLFPVFSFLFLGGKCRYCRKKISWQYPIVELFSGLIFLLISNFVIFSKSSVIPSLIGNPGTSQTLWISAFAGMTSLLFLFYVSSSLIIIFVYDLKHYIIPDKILFPAIIITLVYRILDFGNLNLFRIWNLGFWISAPILNYLLAVLIASGFFLAIFLISRGRAMGFGDVKLAVLMGFLLGLPNILVSLFLAFFFGAIIGVILMVFGRKSADWRMKSEIPFGPFLIAGTFMAMFWGSQIIQWYLHLFLI